MWPCFFEQLKDCGRSGGLFMAVMFAVWIAAPFGGPGAMVLGGVLLVFTVRIGFEIFRQSGRHARLGRLPPLAPRDLVRARERLGAGASGRNLRRAS
jgi:hypothetical protein